MYPAIHLPFICASFITSLALNEALNFTTSPDSITTDGTHVSTEAADVDSPTKNVTISGAHELIASCRHKCQSNESIPCACDVKCPVYSNCCEDFSRECPENFAESIVQYKQFFGLETECTSNKFLLISGCQKNAAYRNVNMTFELESKLSLRDFFRFSDTLPLTDTETNLSYKNWTTFLCNAADNSSPLEWDVILDDLDINSLRSMDDVIKRSEKFYFIPPTDVISPRCPSESINSCGNSPWQDACRSFKSFVRYPHGSVFDNVYCAVCNGADVKRLVPVNESNVHKSDLNFDLLMSVKRRSILFTSTSKHDPWKHVECNFETVKGKKPDTGKMACLATACKDAPVRYLRGKCQRLHELVLATDYVELFDHYQSASDLSRCFLAENAGLDIVQEAEPASICYSTKMSTYVYVLKFLFYDTSEFIVWDTHKKVDLLTNFTLILKILTRLYQFTNSTLELPPHNKVRPVDLQNLPQIAKFSHLFLSKSGDERARVLNLCACSYLVRKSGDGSKNPDVSDCTANCVRAEMTSPEEGYNRPSYHKCIHFLKSTSVVHSCRQLCPFLLAGVTLRYVIGNINSN